MDDIDVFEIEAFASVVLAWARNSAPTWTRSTRTVAQSPLVIRSAAFGAILMTKAIHELQRGDGEYGIVSMCCGGGLGTGTLIKKI